MQQIPVNPEADLYRLRICYNSTICSLDFGGDTKRKTLYPPYEHIRLGATDIFEHHGQSVSSGRRGPQHIKSNPVDNFIFLIRKERDFEISQSGNSSLVKPGNFVILSTLHPFEAADESPPRQIEGAITVKVPGTALRQQAPNIDQCCAVPISAAHGVGAVLKAMIFSIIAEKKALSEIEATQLGSALIDIAGLFTRAAPELRGRSASRSEFSNAAVLMKARSFIERNISNPMLDPALVANNCNVSLRKLHKSFEPFSMTVAAFIRERRLQCCKLELQNAAPGARSINRIAAKWGYGNPANFSRAYHARFGKSPSEERRTATTGT